MQKNVVIEGVVCKGRQLGRKLGFPTANIALTDQVELPDGVYLTQVEWFGRSYNAISNLGTNPTVGGNRRRLETYLLEYDGAPLYGERLKIHLLEPLRSEKHFENLDQLRQQIEKDVMQAQTFFRNRLHEKP